VQGTSWADGLELVGDGDRLVGFAGALPLRLLAERTGLRAGLSAAMHRQGFDPVYDRGQVLIDVALTQVLGGEAISDFPRAQAGLVLGGDVAPADLPSTTTGTTRAGSEHCSPQGPPGGCSRNGSKDAVGNGWAGWTRRDAMDDRRWPGRTPQDPRRGVGRVPFAS